MNIKFSWVKLKLPTHPKTVACIDVMQVGKDHHKSMCMSQKTLLKKRK